MVAPRRGQAHRLPMSPTEEILQLFRRFLPLLATLAITVFALGLANRFLRRRRLENPQTTYLLQLGIVALSIAGLLAVIIVLPINDDLRGDLLGVIGILLSAAIALSSTTFIGNMMAGIMLRTVKSARPGDFITVSALTGRITEMDLLHTEIQTEFRDLVTVPNLYMVTQPLQVVRASGTIISADVTLGYDVHRGEVFRLLSEAATRAGLQDGFVHVRELGDYSVTYRVAGLLKDVESLISSRSRLREAMLDSLHEGGVEIVSPSFMNTRSLGEDRLFIPERARRAAPAAQPQVEEVVFDKAEEAASIERIHKSIEALDAEIAAIGDGEGIPEPRAALQARREALVAELQAAKEDRDSQKLQE